MVLWMIHRGDEFVLTLLSLNAEREDGDTYLRYLDSLDGRYPAAFGVVRHARVVLLRSAGGVETLVEVGWLRRRIPLSTA